MSHLSRSQSLKNNSYQCWIFALMLAACPYLVAAPALPVDVVVTDGGKGAVLAPRFLGLSYEMSVLLPQDGRYYFDARDHALINAYKTLGIRDLRVGANAVDDPQVSIPQEKDIDALFNFARTAGVKVNYSFRLKNGDPAKSARLARYIEDHYADLLECFSIGNEPDSYPKPYPYKKFLADWKPNYDAILKAVPNAMISGPSANKSYALQLARDVYPDGHMLFWSGHYYFLGSGRAAETNISATLARFLSNDLLKTYELDYTNAGAILAAEGVPYRLDEMNSCYNGGAKGASDAYASTLWALDCLHWWAAHHILGVNVHTGESVGRDGGFGAANYAVFVHRDGGEGFNMRPLSYAFLAFNQAAMGCPLAVQVGASPQLNFTAYAYRNAEGAFYITLLNKSHGSAAQATTVSLKLPAGTGTGVWQRLDLRQQDDDIGAKTGVTLGNAAINSEGIWSGQWQKLDGVQTGDLTVQASPASAVLLRFSPVK